MPYVITKSPLRVSFVGGGSDLPSYFLIKKGEVISTTIDYWIKILVQPSTTRTFKINCLGNSQELEDPDHINNIRVREALNFLNITQPLEIVSNCDIPAGTGLGSSSSFTVGLLLALYHYKGLDINWKQLAEEAYFIETSLLKEPIGKQDQSIAAFGNLSHLIFNEDNTLSAERVECPKKVLMDMEKNLMLFHVGQPRQASLILSSISGNNAKQFELLTRLCSFCNEFKQVLQNGLHLHRIGEILDEAWKLKRNLSTLVSTPEIDMIYELSKQKGAIGGKLLGAGGSGFLLLYAPQNAHASIRKALPPLFELPFRFSQLGAHVASLDNEKCITLD